MAEITKEEIIEEEEITEEEERDILQMYGCDESPLLYMLKPKSTIEFVATDEITEEDFADDD